jgi:hypothetical protein
LAIAFPMNVRPQAHGCGSHDHTISIFPMLKGSGSHASSSVAAALSVGGSVCSTVPTVPAAGPRMSRVASSSSAHATSTACGKEDAKGR